MLDRSNQPWSPLEHPELDWVEGVPRHRSFDDIYYSAADGRAESQHVFIDGSGIRDKLSAGSLVVAETGFGTGLNFLLLLQAWRDAASDRKAAARLHYIGLEAQPMTRQQLQQALTKWPEQQFLADRL
ncbi:MAG: bifunctional tRNA (5-methylaminomethyl-2-thiouridine)(34)-methyltransferase MnmD/FAD-dependent 5-carboxymethylaminomethyl-2-thiouridine(34) oxidoreductase MnmC, partial [Luminiphilus sp.]